MFFGVEFWIAFPILARNSASMRGLQFSWATNDGHFTIANEFGRSNFPAHELSATSLHFEQPNESRMIGINSERDTERYKCFLRRQSPIEISWRKFVGCAKSWFLHELCDQAFQQQQHHNALAKDCKLSMTHSCVLFWRFSRHRLFRMPLVTSIIAFRLAVT